MNPAAENRPTITILFPGGQTVVYRVSGGAKGILTRLMTVYTEDEGMTTPFAVDLKTGTARLGGLPAETFSEEKRPLLDRLRLRAMSADEVAAAVAGKRFRFEPAAR